MNAPSSTPYAWDEGSTCAAERGGGHRVGGWVVRGAERARLHDTCGPRSCRRFAIALILQILALV